MDLSADAETALVQIREAEADEMFIHQLRPFSQAPEHGTIQVPSGDRLDAGVHLSRTEHQFSAGLREAVR